MAADFRITFKPNRAFQRFQREGASRMKDVQRAFVKRVTFGALAEAQKNTPVVTGALRRSEFADLKRLPQLRARVRAQEPYARRVHNLPRGGEGSGGRRGPRFFSRAIDQVQGRLSRWWREEVGKLLD